jgi:hypothetical protein
MKVPAANAAMIVTLSASIPPSGEVFAFGATVLTVTMLLHGWGLGRIVKGYRRSAAQLLRKAAHPYRASLAFGEAIFLMLVLHLAENWLWTLVIYKAGLIRSVRDCFYFVANCYTTLAYGDVPLGIGWRELSPIIAISGLFTFGWTTSVMFNVVGYQQDLRDEMAEIYAKKIKMREALLSRMKTLFRGQSRQTRLEFAAERKQESNRSLLSLLRLRMAERKTLIAMRRRVNRLAAEKMKEERGVESRLYKSLPRRLAQK